MQTPEKERKLYHGIYICILFKDLQIKREIKDDLILHKFTFSHYFDISFDTKIMNELTFLHIR